MRFEVYCTSKRNSNEPPCPDAEVEVEVGTHLVTRYRDYYYLDEHGHPQRLSYQAEEPYVIYRWYIEVPDLEDLLRLSTLGDYGGLILHPGPPPTLEIYDDYRE